MRVRNDPNEYIPEGYKNSTNNELDTYGKFFGIPRGYNESDAMYSSRIINTLKEWGEWYL